MAMADIARQHIFLLDDELEVCEVVSETLEEAGFEVDRFTRPADCLEQMSSERCDLLITDLKMPQMNGIELLTEAKRLAPWMPILMITGYGDVPTAVTAMKAGAVDFIEKPLDRESFLHKVSSILQKSRSIDSNLGKRLTENEKKVLKHVLEGRSNKEIAFLLNRSMRTVEVHRAHLMRKLGVDNVVDLMKRVSEMGLVEPPPKKRRRDAGEDSEKHP